MSWLSENYDKAALGVAAVAAIAVGYSIFSGGKEVPKPNPAVPNNTVEIEQRKALAILQEKFAEVNAFEEKKSSGNEVQSFVAFPLYSIKGQSGVKSLTDDFEIHPGMPLKWWKKYDLKDYELKNGPELDGDKDGFTNREEFDGETDPTDKASHPDFIAKLKCEGVEDQKFEVKWSKVSPERGNFKFKIGRKSTLDTLGVGGKFPSKWKDESFINRFEILEKGQDPNIPGEQGEYYLLQDNGERQEKRKFKLFYNKNEVFKDHTATLLLDVDGARKSFKVPEGGMFSLPHDDDKKPKSYKFKSKKDGKVEIEYDLKGEKSSIDLEIQPKK